MVYKTIRKLSKKEIGEFFDSVDLWRPMGCWMWLGPLDTEWYGTHHIDSVVYRAHRVSLSIVRDVPTDSHVHHKCGNPSCVNPLHLELLAEKEHMSLHQMTRRKQGKMSGQKLTAEIVEQIKQKAFDGAAHKVVAAEYGIDRTSVGQIVRGKKWPDIRPDLTHRRRGIRGQGYIEQVPGGLFRARIGYKGKKYRFPPQSSREEAQALLDEARARIENGRLPKAA